MLDTTENHIKYHFADFTHKEYETMLQTAKSKYEFRLYEEIQPEDSFVLWRHDIDFSVEASLALAKLETANQVRSTFFIHLHSEFYNPLERQTADKIREIVALGHDIGLHFDFGFYDRDTPKLEHYLGLEKEILECTFQRKIKVFSFHNPTEFELTCENYQYSNMVNTYAEFFKQQVGYCSDSNGYWRHERMKDYLLGTSEPRLQILTHPNWWHEETLSPKQKIVSCIEQRATSTYAQYEATLALHNRENIDW